MQELGLESRPKTLLRTSVPTVFSAQSSFVYEQRPAALRERIRLREEREREL